MALPAPVIKPTFWRWILILFFLSVAVLFFKIFPLINDLIVVLIISLVLTYIIRPGMVLLEEWGIPRVYSILGIFAVVIGFIAVTLWFFIPLLIDQLGSMVEFLEKINLTKIEDKVISWLSGYSPKLAALFETNGIESDDFLTRVSKAASGFLRQSLSFLAGAANVITLSTVVPVITFFLLKDGDRFIKGLIERVPNRFFEMSVSLSYRIDQQLGGYIRITLLESLIVGVICWIAFEIAGIKFALVLGMLNGLLNMIPFFGPLIAYVPTGLVVVITYTPVELGLFWMVVILIGAQMIDNVLLKPILVSRSINIHPAAVLLVVLIGGKIAGPLGMFIAVPAYAVIKVIVVDFYTHLKDYRII